MWRFLCVIRDRLALQQSSITGGKMTLPGMGERFAAKHGLPFGGLANSANAPDWLGR